LERANLRPRRLKTASRTSEPVTPETAETAETAELPMCSKNFRANLQYLHPAAAAATPEAAETAETAERPLRQSPALPIPLDKPETTETALRETTETAT